MKVVRAVGITACVLALTTAYLVHAHVTVPKVGNLVVVDAIINLISEWNGSAVLAWRSALSLVEFDRVYILHNSTHYLFAAKLYDPDSVADDELVFYVNASGHLYKYVLPEDSSAIQAFNYTGGSWVSFTSSALLLSGRSHHHDPWIGMELAVPKSEWGNASRVLLYLEHINHHKLLVVSRYPQDAGPSDQTKWAELLFEEVAGQYAVDIELRDRDAHTIEYVADKTWAIFRLPNGTIYTQVAPNGSTVHALLPPENYTVTVEVYGIPIFNTTINLSANYSATYVLNNLKREDTAGGTLVAVLQIPANISSIFINCERGYGLLITNSTERAHFYVFSDADWEHVVVLDALNFSYDPYSNTLYALMRNGTSGVVLICAPEGYPVFYEASNTVKGYVYRGGVLEAWVNSGSYKVLGSGEPFAVALNGTALRRGADYTVDAFNVTSINMCKGTLSIYYDNPIGAKVEPLSPKLVIHLGTPYKFTGHVVVEVYDEEGRRVTSIREGFTATPSLTWIEVDMSGLAAGEYELRISIYDDDSGKLVAQEEILYMVEEAVTPTQNALVMLLVMAALIGVVAAWALLKSARHAVAEALRERRRFVRRRE